MERRVQELLQTQDQLQTILNNIPLVLFALDTEGLITFSAGRALAALGTRAGANLGRSVFDAYADAPHIHEQIRRALGGEEFGVCNRLRGLTFETRFTPIYSPAGRLTGTLGVALDITERCRGQQRQAFLAEASTLLTASLDYEDTLGGIRRLLIPRMCDWFSLFEAAGDDFEILKVGHVAPGKELLLRELRQRGLERPRSGGTWAELRAGRSVFEPRVSRATFLSASDELVTRLVYDELGCRSVIHVPLSCRGKLYGTLLLCRATDENPYDRDDLALLEELAHWVALAMDNARLFGEAQRAIQARDEFLSVASHELRTPLTALQLQVELLLRHDGELAATRPPSSMQESLLEKTHRLTKRLGHLVGNLLDVSRIDAGRLHLVLDDVDVAEVCRDIAARLELEATRAGCTVRVMAPAAIVGRWDRLRLEQVVTNLLSNAFKYGGGRPIEVILQADAEAARIAVVDHGEGIRPQDVPRIFGRFERASSGHHAGSLGLGLYIVHKIAGALGGAVSVQSTVGAGSTFTVELPRSPGTGPIAGR